MMRKDPERPAADTEEVLMVRIRPYRETDAPGVGVLIADTFGEFNLAYASPEERQLLLGPFRNARSADPAHRRAIAEIITSR